MYRNKSQLHLMRSQWIKSILRGGGHGPKNYKNQFRDNGWPKRFIQWGNFLVEFWGPRPLGASLAATPIFGPKMPKPLKKHPTHDLWCSTGRYHSPGLRDILKFEIGWKMTELWPKNVCPYMGICAEIGHFWPISWPNINIFERNQFYMIITTVLHVLCSL